MTAPTLTEIMDGLDARLATITGLRHKAYVADQINPPAAVVQIPDIDNYRATFNRGNVDINISVFLFVSTRLDRVGQKEAAEFVSWTGANSIPLALEATTVPITGVNQVVVESFRNFGIEQVGVIGYYGGEFKVLVVTGA